MKRSIYSLFIKWKNDPYRLPLIIKGARQVGKSFAVENFGKDHFNSIAIVNFEINIKFSECFDSLEPLDIIQNLEILLKQEIIPGKTLLFLDEIQICPRAIIALRYFLEKLPQLHVIAAGSLLEFTLRQEKFSFPVGRVQFLYMKPLSFIEFLQSQNESKALKLLSTASIKNSIAPPIHDYLLQSVRNYFLIGGMPAIVNIYNLEKSFLKCQQLQSTLLLTYHADFGKYAALSQQKYVKIFFEKAPEIIAKHFQYKKIDPNIRSRELKSALEKLCFAGLLHRIYATSANGIPLRTEKNENKFKLLFLDIGLYQNAMQVDLQYFQKNNLLDIHEGSLAEQFVGQELLAYATAFEDKSLYFWKREKRQSSAEIDYVINIDSNVVPIEVKAGKTGRLRSLKQFMAEKKCPVGVQISQAPLQFKDNILTVPFYMISTLPKLLKDCYQSQT